MTTYRSELDYQVKVMDCLFKFVVGVVATGIIIASIIYINYKYPGSFKMPTKREMMLA